MMFARALQNVSFRRDIKLVFVIPTELREPLVPFIEVDQSEHIHIREVVTDTTFTHAISVETAADLHVSLVEITG